MPDTKKTNSTSTEKSGETGFKSCCGDYEKMSQVMQKFCCSEDGTFDCGAMMDMMQKMCGEKTSKTDQASVFFEHTIR